MHKDLQIFRQADPLSALAEAGENLNYFLAENKKLPVLLMLSGGSALSITDYVGPAVLGANLTISVLDERFSQDSEANNFLQLQKTDFYKDAFEAEASFFGTVPRGTEGMQDLRQRWDKNIRTWRKENPKGLIAATLGMGQDGHTAGIFPFPEDPIKFDRLFNNREWTVAYNAAEKNKYAERVSVTLAFLRMLNAGFAFVAGKEKQEKFNLLLSRNAKAAELPAAIWHEMKSVKVFTDL